MTRSDKRFFNVFLIGFVIGTFGPGVTAHASDVSRNSTSEPVVIRNPETGWRESPISRLSFEEDLAIGLDESDSNQLFSHVIAICSDSRHYIYVVETSALEIRVFDDTGKFVRKVGRWGEGPGEYGFVTAITVDEADRLYVADMSGQIRIYDADGQFIGQIAHGYPGGGIRSMRIDPDGNLFLSCLDILEQKIIHKYNMKGELILSFCDSWGVGRKDMDVRLESTFGGGKLDLDDQGIVYYSQMVPYEIRKYSREGDLLAVVFRENSFMKTPEARVTENTFAVTMPTNSAAIVVLRDGRFINVVKKPPEPEPPAETIIDLFDGEGHLLASERYKRNFNLMWVDDSNRLYGFDSTEVPVVLRYRLNTE